MPPALAIALLFLFTRGISLLGMLFARHGDLGGTVAAASRLYDSGWYDLIVLHGYVDPGLGQPITVFYPGYPAVVSVVYWPLRLVASLFVNGFTLGSLAEGTLLPLATLLVCNLALIGALAILWRLYAPRLGQPAALLGIGFLLAAPTSFFFSAGYSESLFILAVAAAFLLAERGCWKRVGLLGAAACLIRFPGAFLVFPLAMIWLKGRRRGRPRGAIGGLLIFTAGAVAYPAWLWLTSGDPLAYLHLQQTHHRFLAGPARAIAGMVGQTIDAMRVLLGHPSGQRLVDVPTIAANSLALLGGIVTGTLGRTRLRTYEVVWVILVLLVPLLSGTGESLDRYLLAAFPLFFLLGWWLRRWPVMAAGLMALSTAWLFYLSYNFAHVIWVG